MMSGDTDDILRYLRKLAYATVVLFVMLIVASGLFFWRISGIANDGLRAHDAVCVLRADLEKRANATDAYLLQHPAGIPGIPIATLKASVASQRQTVAALAVANCD